MKLLQGKYRSVNDPNGPFTAHDYLCTPRALDIWNSLMESPLGEILQELPGEVILMDIGRSPLMEYPGITVVCDVIYEGNTETQRVPAIFINVEIIMQQNEYRADLINTAIGGVLVHETCHYEQFRTGRLEITYNATELIATWEGDLFSTTGTNYVDWPWEAEAYRHQAEFCAKHMYDVHVDELESHFRNNAMQALND